MTWVAVTYLASPSSQLVVTVGDRSVSCCVIVCVTSIEPGLLLIIIVVIDNFCIALFAN